MVNISFYGAAKTVTGSCYLVKTDSCSFLVDCGMFQGPKDEHLNLSDLAFDATKIDFVLLTHAHMDHAGMLPKLITHGYKGPIFATLHTAQIASPLLMDSAKIQESNFERGANYGKFTSQKGYAYTTRDSETTIGQLRSVQFDSEIYPSDNVKVTFKRAGHILGAASIMVEIVDNNETKKILFSGDIGRTKNSLIESFDLDDRLDPDYVLIESLYGGQIHPSRDDSVAEMVNIINETVKRGGNVFMPCFAVERTQEIINDLRIAYQNGTLTKEASIWLDSPLAQTVTRIYVAALQDTLENLFDFPSFRYIQKYKHSQKLNKKQGQVIIAGSGMADGGRIVGHLATGIGNDKNSVVFVGYQAEGTLGREITTGATNIQIGEQNIQVKAKIYHLQGFSAHGDSSDYLLWINRLKKDKIKKIFLVHAEPDRSLAFDLQLKENGYSQTYIPSMNETIQL